MAGGGKAVGVGDVGWWDELRRRRRRRRRSRDPKGENENEGGAFLLPSMEYLLPGLSGFDGVTVNDLVVSPNSTHLVTLTTSVGVANSTEQRSKSVLQPYAAVGDVNRKKGGCGTNNSLPESLASCKKTTSNSNSNNNSNSNSNNNNNNNNNR